MARLLFLLTALAGTALAKDVSFTSGETTGCITLSHIQALSQTFTGLSNSTAYALPAIPEEYITNPSACVPESLYNLYFEPIVEVAKQEDLLSNLDKVLAVGGDAGLRKRARNCPQIKDAAIQKSHSFSCDSAPHPDACRSCANFSTVNFVASCVACAAKANQESVFCCAAAATTFATYYSQVCLSK